MKKKSLIIILSLVLVVLAVGVTFASWGVSNLSKKYDYVINANSYNDVKIDQVVNGDGKLMPKDGATAATVIVNTVLIKVKGYACDLDFEIKDIMYKVGEEWVTLDAGVLNIELFKGDNKVTLDTNVLGDVEYTVKVSFIPSIDVIDPIYKSSEFKFTIYADVTKSVA